MIEQFISEEQRILIDELMSRREFDAIPGAVPGIVIVQNVKKMSRVHNCLSYAMSLKIPGNPLSIVNCKVVGEETDLPQSGDLVFYYSPGGFLTHGGIYRGDGRVQSKLNLFSHVYEHPRLAVPLWFGDQTRYFLNRPLDNRSS